MLSITSTPIGSSTGAIANIQVLDFKILPYFYFSTVCKSVINIRNVVSGLTDNNK